MGNKQKSQTIKLKEKITDYKLYYKVQNKRCVTSFAVLKDNKIMLNLFWLN